MSRGTGLRAGRIAAVLSLTAAACGGGDDDDESPDEGSPQSGGTLTFIIQNELTSLDPASNTSAAGAGSLPYYALYDALLTLDPETGNAEPKIAESLTPDSTGAIWTLKLTPGVEFSDGTPYDAAAVAFNWERLKDPALQSPLAAAASEIASTKVVDPTTLEVTLTAPDSGFDKNVAQQLLFIASPTALRVFGRGVR